MRSSYVLNNYAEVFDAVVHAFRPRSCVELGVLDGYSAIAIGKALRRNHQMFGVEGHLLAYDLFEKYEYTHARYDDVQERLRQEGLQDVVRLVMRDALRAHEGHVNAQINLLHVDLSNTGETLRHVMEHWDPLIVHGGVILFEGGSEERDRVEWMVKYAKPPIKPELDSNKIIEEKYVYATYLAFPSLTCLLKKRE